MRTQATTIVLVHGAWHGAWCWAATQAALDALGVPSLAVDLPGHGASPLPYVDLYGDAALVRQVIQGIGGPVVLVGHSYGGAVISEASIGLNNVAHLVYLTAFCLDEGEAVRANPAPRPPVALNHAIVQAEQEGFLAIDPAGAHAAFYGDCTDEMAAAAIARLCLQPMATFTQPVTSAPWRSTPSTYVVCENDEAIHPDTQRFFAARCASVVTFASDHSPFASHPQQTAAVLATIASGVSVRPRR